MFSIADARISQPDAHHSDAAGPLAPLNKKQLENVFSASAEGPVRLKVVAPGNKPPISLAAACRLLARSGHPATSAFLTLLGGKRTSFGLSNSVGNDPEPT